MRRFRNFGCHLVTSRYSLPDLLRHAQFLDSNGFDLVTVGDHTLIPNSAATYPNAQMVLGYLGSITKNCRLSPAVTDPLRRHPVEIAQATVTLDQLTHGRAMLGIGAGEMMNLEPFGFEWGKAYTRLVEAIDVIKLLWGSSPAAPVDYQGEFFRLARAYLQIRQFGARPPPIYVGAVGRKTRELVGEKADGWLPVIESPASLRSHLEDVGRGVARSGRQVREIDATVTFYSEVSDDRSASLKTVEPVARMQLTQERSVLELTSGMKVPERLSVQRLLANDVALSRELQDFGAGIPMRVIEDVTAVGPVEDCIKKLEQFLDSGATSFLLCNLSRDQERTFGAYAQGIVPYLRENYGV
ncbi:MAG: LLM class flavin-dependent oxidoreductase [Nitrososphaerota archaeon]|jgi:alkanesulfonate monooxygenase SsuD/methylene tetrahydromethanopterin reductase-like flavin-dependent oxidoreductase (luciferase family)|nr:LLM class flavin-dependent oxidoreductase [Nitrososphaerota archaeon]